MISISLFGIRNPNTPVSSNTYILSTYDSTASNIIETFSIVNSLMLSTVFAVQDTNITKINMVPTNAVANAYFEFILNASFTIPINSLISITFPSSFGVLYSNTLSTVECYSFGGLNALTQCQIVGAGKTIQMQAGETSIANYPITIRYYGLVSFPNPNVAITGFSIAITYLGLAIAQQNSAWPSVITTGFVGK